MPKESAPLPEPVKAKQRLTLYLTTEQIEKVRLLAIENNENQSKIVGNLIDGAPAPSFKRS